MNLLEEFDALGEFVASLNSTFLVLILKFEGAMNIKDVRPISLVDSIYKLVAKFHSQGLL